MIETRQLTKRYGALTAVDGITFKVEPGRVLGFLGPNGAGKSTTMKMIAGFLAPTSGSVLVCGHDVSEDPIAAKRVIGYLPEGAPSYGEMNSRQFLDFIADVRGLDRRTPPHAPRRRDRTAASQSACSNSPSKRCRKDSSAASDWRRRFFTIPLCWSWTNRPTVWTRTRNTKCVR